MDAVRKGIATVFAALGALIVVALIMGAVILIGVALPIIGFVLMIIIILFVLTAVFRESITGD